MMNTTERELLSVSHSSPPRATRWLPVLAAVGVACYVAPRVIVGADTMWMVALGGQVAASGSVPEGVPFAAADTGQWPNVPVLGELAMYWVGSLGRSALAMTLIIAGTIMLLVLARAAMKAGAHPAAVAVTLVLTAIGMLPTVGVVRAQLLSLVPFAALVVLLRAETRAPSRRIWLAPPLVAIWGNLHGGVLVGVALIGCYLLLVRLKPQPGTAILVGLASVAAVFANPAFLRTPSYYLGVLSNEAARRGSEMWGRPDLGSGFDLLMLISALALGTLAIRWGGTPLWEILVILAMGAATATASRHGMWLLMFLLGPAATGLTRAAARSKVPTASLSPHDVSESRPHPAEHPSGRWLVAALTFALAGVSAVAIASRAESLNGPSRVVASIKALAGSQVVLAPEPLVEDLAAAGVTVWVSNPIDAFLPEDQAAYLDVWLGRDSGRRAIEASDVVVARLGSPALTLASSTGCIEVGRATDFAVLTCRH